MALFGGPEAIIVLIIVLLLFGASRLPKVARGMGEAVRELRHATRDDDDADVG